MCYSHLLFWLTEFKDIAVNKAYSVFLFPVWLVSVGLSAFYLRNFCVDDISKSRISYENFQLLNL